MEGSHAAKGKLTPWPSEERIRKLDSGSPVSNVDVEENSDEEAEVDQVLMRRRMEAGSGGVGGDDNRMEAEVANEMGSSSSPILSVDGIGG